MPIVSIARVVLGLDKTGFTRKEAAFADSVWMIAALAIFGISMWLW